MNDIERQLRELGDRTTGAITYREVPRRRIVRRARLRRAVTVAVPVTAIVLAAAVAYPRFDGIERRGAPAPVDLAAVAEATEGAGSARIEFSMSSDFDTSSFASTVTGEVDFERRRSYLRGTFDDPSGGSDEFEVILAGNLSFQRSVGDPKWEKTKLASGTAPFGGGPDEYFAYLTSASEEVVTVGEEVLDGVRVTHLRATLDTSRVEEAIPSGEVSFDPLDVWLDDANRVRKMTFGMSMEGSDPGMNGTASTTVRFWDFGVPVEIEAPAPNEVADAGAADRAPSSEATGEGVDLPDPWFVTGERGTDEAYVIVSGPEGPFSITCVRGLPFPARVTIVDEEAGRSVHSFPRIDVLSDERFDGCTESPPIARELLDDPARFRLRLHTEGGSIEVALTTSSRADPPPE